MVGTSRKQMTNLKDRIQMKTHPSIKYINKIDTNDTYIQHNQPVYLMLPPETYQVISAGEN